MLHTKFRGNRPAGSGEEFFYGFIPYRDVAAVLVMRPASCHQIFISLYLKDFTHNLVQVDTVDSEKIQFEILYVHDLQYSHIFIYLMRCLLTLTFRLLAAIVSEKSTVYTKPKLQNLTLP